MKVLLLGGTHEATCLARDLHEGPIQVVYSIAGLVRHPDLPCTVVSGGFRGVGGLNAFLQSEGIGLVVDATHPYASRMSTQAAESALKVGIPCWRYLRPPWRPRQGDNWRPFVAWGELRRALVHHKAVLFATGRLEQSFVDKLYGDTRRGQQCQWVRSANRPEFQLPPSMTWVEAVGPYTVHNERKVMCDYGIDAVVSKNSGGDHTSAKLTVASELGIPVYMLERPTLPEVEREFSDIGCCRDAVFDFCCTRGGHVG